MAEQSLWQRIMNAIEQEYDRRIRAASLITEYGAGHHGHEHEDEDDGEVAEIMNVPRGTRIGRE
ncbi:hypothetical protein CJ255_08575 [Candidatus Viridilinea mediisalina]|uniref:Uncharacterized protein n=2 Tax=Candidatus Viridilinea mediisalina TaxID=2024553 RepID=A0A2A6RK57_9CHLR|nr:hypothetical protein CJ255_08575 [Candidatus Viridilinea mediisalina]